jgi:phosphoribosylformimino-5-aminoimidazole carboxamide ribotide isomerase
LKILPVLDLKDGRVVRGIAGRRDQYRPIESRLCDGSAAGDVARALNRAFDFRTCYLADLDAIAGGEPNWALYDFVVEAGLGIWLDAGTGTPPAAARVAEYLANQNGAGRVVVGLESLADGAALGAIVDAVGAEQIVFSLDLKDGVPLTASPGWRGLEPAEIAGLAVSLGVRSLIVLDLAGVGVGRGVPTLELCRRLRTAYPELEITTGGGVRNLADLTAVREAGCDAALVASAVHDGRITPEALAESEFGTPDSE